MIALGRMPETPLATAEFEYSDGVTIHQVCATVGPPCGNCRFFLPGRAERREKLIAIGFILLLQHLDQPHLGLRIRLRWSSEIARQPIGNRNALRIGL